MSKKLLIIEKSNTTLSTVNENGNIYLEGVFTQFGVKNKNNRIYEEAEVLPHINQLQEKVGKSKLLGELDHPKAFDISLSNASHVIENLRYDEQKKQVIGRIRLLNTSKGKEAQALIEDGIPLHISSRAAGTVGENNKVKIKKWFTYDLVADPGFENAELVRINESLGYEEDDSLFIYEMDEEISETTIENTEEKNISEMQQYVTSEDFNTYSEYLKDTILKLEKKLEEKEVVEKTESVDEDKFKKLVEYVETVSEKVNSLIDYTEYVAENADNGIVYSEYIVKNMGDLKEYVEYISENLDNTIQYTEMVAEKSDKGIQYTESIAEKVDEGLRYSNYLREKLENSIGYMEYIKEGVEKGVSYTEYIAEELNKSYEDLLNEKKALNESKEEEGSIEELITETAEEVGDVTAISEDYKKSISEKLSLLIEKAETSNPNEMFFMNFLSDVYKYQFDNLTEEKQKEIVEAMNTKRCMSSADAHSIWESCFTAKAVELDIISNMPELYKDKWEKLSEERKEQIINESKIFTLDTQYKITNFWQTRDLRSKQIETEQLNESAIAKSKDTETEALNEEFKQNLIDKVKSGLGR